MTDAPPPAPTERSLPPRVQAIAFGSLSLSLVLALVLIVVFALRAAEADTVTVRASPSVLVAVRDLARLESVQFHMERVIDARDSQRAVFGLVQADDALLLVAVGDVSAGVDLGRLREGDVQVDDARRRVRLVLPRAEVLSARLDAQRTYVHGRSTDLLARRNEQLESRARAEAEAKLRDAAIEGGILERADANAKRTIESLVRSLGYEDVQITTRP